MGYGARAQAPARGQDIPPGYPLPVSAPGCTSRRIRSGSDADLRILDWPGARRPFVLVPGLASNALLWGEVGDRLAAAGHRVVAVDLLGHGHSDPPVGHYSTAAAVADLAALIAELGLAGPVLAGQSWGGNVVLSYAAGHPGVHAVACIDGGWIHLADRFATFAACWKVLAPPDLDGMTAVAFGTLLRRSHPDWSARAITATVANLRTGPDGVLERRLPLAQHESILRSMYDEPPRQWYPHVEVPVLLVPAGDPEGPSAALVAEARDALPQAKVSWYVGADHDVHAQHPIDIAADLLALA